jgi:hypothetical protein
VAGARICIAVGSARPNILLSAWIMDEHMQMARNKHSGVPPSKERLDLSLRNRSWRDFEIVHNGSVKVIIVEVTINLIARE